MPSPADDSTLPPESGRDDESLLGKVQQILGQLGPVDTTHAPGGELPGAGGDGGGTPPAPPASGEAPGPFDDYEILEMLGKGGMGVVYKAHQRSLNRFVAVKVLKTDAPAGPEVLRRFQDEAKAVAHLDHPHIVPIFEVGSCDGEPYFTMKLVAGSSLNHRMKRYLDRPRDAAALVRTLALAIQHAHDRGILHRDLKPHNVLLDEEGRPHVTDFGLALRLTGEDAQTRTGVAGTPRYMAPEQTLGRRDAITTATDVHGLGTILYALLTGSHPFDRDEDATVLDVLDEVRNRMPDPPSALNPAVPRDLEVICLKCLQKAPSGRYRSAAELAADLDRWLDGRPITARPVGAAGRTWMWSRRNPLAAAGIAALILASLLIPPTLAAVGLERARRSASELKAAQADLKSSQAEAAQQRERAEALRLGMLNDARRFLDRGQWRDALDKYAAAVADGAAEDVSLRLERLKACDGLSDKPRALGELAEIRRLVQSGELQPTPKEDALVKLREADLIAGSGEDANDRSDALLREALAGPLPDAERAYATGLLADTIDEAARQFQATLERDPYHHRARVSFALTLILAGKAEEARRQVEVGAAMFPEDPAIRLIGAFGCAVRDRCAEARVQLQRAGRHLPPGQLNASELVVDIFDRAFRAADTEPLEPGALIGAVLQSLPAIFGALVTNQDNGDAPTFGAPPRFVRDYMKNLALALYSIFMRDDGMLNPLMNILFARFGVRQLDDREIEVCFERAVRANPEALLLAIQGYWLWEHGRIAEGEQSLLAAVEAPSLLPPGLVRRKALSALVSVDTSRLIDLGYHPGLPDPVLDRWGNPVDPLELRGVLRRLREACLECQGSVLLDSPALAHDLGQAAWLAGDLDLADLLIRQGLQRNPGDPGLTRTLAFIQACQGEPLAMLRLADSADAGEAALWRFRARVRWDAALHPERYAELPADPFAL